jgi:iron complex outermembrane recepter protein
MKQKPHTCLLIGWIVLVVASAPALHSAQAPAELRGRISNQATSDNLGGATVRVEGTTHMTYTERDGTYVLRNLPPGQATVRVTYPGLDPATADVTLTAGVTSRHDFALTSAIYVLPEYTVAGTREGNALAIVRQEQSPTVMNTVSSDAFGSISQDNIANVLRRLPGVVGEVHATNVGSISVRGMDEQHTVVSIDGTAGAGASIETDGIGASTGSLGRASLPLGSVPAEFIESVEVIKTPTADMDADSLGGVVNLRTKSAFDAKGRTLNLTAGVNYNLTRGKDVNPTKSEYLFPSFQLVYGDVYNVLGGENNLGMFITGKYSVSGETTGVIRVNPAPDWDFQGPTLPNTVAFPDSFQFWRNDTSSFNAKFDYKLAEGSSIGLSGGYTKYRRSKDDMRPRLDGGSRVVGVGPNHELSSDTLWVFDNAQLELLRQTHIRETETWRWSLQGDHRMDTVRMTWDLTYSPSSEVWEWKALQLMTTADVISFHWDRSSYMHPKFIQTGGRSVFTNNMDNLARNTIRAEHNLSSHDVYGARFDIEKSFDRWRMPFKVKTGLRVRREDRDVDYNIMRGGTNILAALGPDFSAYVDPRWTYDFHGGMPNVPMPDPVRFYADAGIRYVPGGNPNNPAVPYVWDPAFISINENNVITASSQNDWATRDTVSAAFLQSEVKLAERLRMTAGLRYEKTDVSVTMPFDDVRAPTVAERWAKSHTFKSDYDTWFPNIQFRYEPWNRVIFRAAHSTTIGRPRIGDIAGRISVDEQNEIVSFSNSALSPQKGQNIDLSVEYYFEPVGVVSVGVFRKRLDNFITSTTFPITGNEFGLELGEWVGWEGRTKENIGKGTVDGIELNYSQQFSFLPGLWKGFGVYANWTQLSSKGDFGELNPPPHIPVKNVLPKFRPKTGNAGLSYAYGRWDLRLMWNHTAAYLEAPNFARLDLSLYRGKREQIDFFGSFQLTPRIQMFAEVLNIGPEDDTAYFGVVSGPRQRDTVYMPTMLSVGMKARY